METTNRPSPQVSGKGLANNVTVASKAGVNSRNDDFAVTATPLYSRSCITDLFIS